MMKTRPSFDREWLIANTLAPIITVLLMANLAAGIVAHVPGVSVDINDAAWTFFRWEFWLLYWGFVVFVIGVIAFGSRPPKQRS